MTMYLSIGHTPVHYETVKIEVRVVTSIATNLRAEDGGWIEAGTGTRVLPEMATATATTE